MAKTGAERVPNVHDVTTKVTSNDKLKRKLEEQRKVTGIKDKKKGITLASSL